MEKEMFRKAALERMSSPEQLDQSIKVIPSLGWLALGGCGLMILGVLIWAIFGIIPSKVSGNGILIKSGGIYQVESSGAGVVKNVFFKEGDMVKNGQVIARIEQKALLDELNNARETQNNIEDNYNRLVGFSEKSMNLNVESIGEKKANLRNTIKKLGERRAFLAKSVDTQEGLYTDGLITLNQLMASRNELNSIELQISDTEAQIADLEINRHQLTGDSEQQVVKLRQQISEAKRAVERIQFDYKKKTEIIADVTGVILEVVVEKGDYINIGSPVVTVEISGTDIKNIQAILYFNPGEGKKIKRGMRVALSPTTIKQEEYGYIMGIVTDVSSFPSSQQRMMKTLQNGKLIEMLSSSGAPLEVRADLIPDPRTPSGFKWSSSIGPTMNIESGFICTGSVSVSEQRPISLVIPIIKKTVLGIGESAVGSGTK
jgi:HlyD family secretion protein